MSNHTIYTSCDIYPSVSQRYSTSTCKSNQRELQFLDSAKSASNNTFVMSDEEIYENASALVRYAEGKLKIRENPEQRNYVFIKVFKESLERVGQNTNPSDLHLRKQGHKMIATFIMHLLRHNFDSQGAFESCGFGDWEDLKSVVLAFKKPQFSILMCLSFLHTLKKNIKHSDLETILSFEFFLQEEYDFWEKNIPTDRLSIWTEVAWEMVELIKRELKKKRKAGEVEGVVNACLECLKFLKSDSFDSRGKTEFVGYEGTRHLQILCLLFKFKVLPGFSESQSRPNTSDKDDRGKNVLRYRCKRLVGFGGEAYQFGKFWQHIMLTKIVDLKGCYFVRDHRTEDNGKKNKLLGVLFYWILSSAAEAESLLKLFLAWCEPKYRRDQVFGFYPKLHKFQHDGLTPEEDRRRSDIRQEMVRKVNSMAPEPQFTYTSVKNKNGVMKPKKQEIPPTQKQLEEHNTQEAKIRETLCGEGRWSDEALQHQKLMYHFTFALKNEDKEAYVLKSKKLSSNLPPGEKFFAGSY